MPPLLVDVGFSRPGGTVAIDEETGFSVNLVGLGIPEVAARLAKIADGDPITLDTTGLGLPLAQELKNCGADVIGFNRTRSTV